MDRRQAAAGERKIQIIEQSAERLLLAVEAAGRGAVTIVVFAVLWNAISWTMAIVFFGAAHSGKWGRSASFPSSALGCFW